MYNGLQRKLNDLLDATPLMTFVLTDQQAQIAIKKNNTALKSYNKRIWLIIVFFCFLVAVTGPLFVEDWVLWAMICLAFAVFFTFVFLIATLYRVNRFKKADLNVIINHKGVYFTDQFCTFKMPGVGLSQTEYDPKKALLTLMVTAVTTAGPADSTVIIPIPDAYKIKIETNLAELPTT